MVRAPHDAPTAAQLIEAVREWLERDVAASTEGRLKFHARVAVNVLAIVERELELGGRRRQHTRGPARTVGRAPTTPSSPPAIRRHEFDDRLDEVRELLLSSVIDKLLGRQPEVTLNVRGVRRHRLTGGELTARGVDVGAPVAAHRGVDARGLEQVAERRGPASAACPASDSRGRVERDQVDVRGRAQPAAHPRQLGGVAVAVVDAVDHRPLEAQPAALHREVVGARLRPDRRSGSAC